MAGCRESRPIHHLHHLVRGARAVHEQHTDSDLSQPQGRPESAYPGYGWNYNEFGYYSGGFGRGDRTRLAEVEYPASAIIIGDSEDAHDRGYDGSQFLYRRHSYLLPDRHNGGGNMGFCDGHAKWYQKSYLKTAPGAPEGVWRN